MSHSISFFVAGIPIPKGSSRAFPIRRKSGRLGVAVTNANPQTKPWQSIVQYYAQKVMPKGAPFVKVPVNVSLIFYLPKTGPKKRFFPITKPDIDKLARTILDALTGVYFHDDAQVTDLEVLKRYDTDNQGRCGVDIELQVKE